MSDKKLPETSRHEDPYTLILITEGSMIPARSVIDRDIFNSYISRATEHIKTHSNDPNIHELVYTLEVAKAFVNSGQEDDLEAVISRHFAEFDTYRNIRKIKENKDQTPSYYTKFLTEKGKTILEKKFIYYAISTTFCGLVASHIKTCKEDDDLTKLYDVMEQFRTSSSRTGQSPLVSMASPSDLGLK